MSRTLRAARVALATLAIASGAVVASAAPAQAVTGSPNSVSWGNATTNTGAVDTFDEGTVNFPLPINNVTELQIVTSGYGHSHGGTVTLAVQLLPSGQTVWATSVASGLSVPMAIDVPVSGQPTVTGVRITSNPFQSWTYHNFAASDSVVVYGEIDCPEVAGQPVCAAIVPGDVVHKVDIANVGTYDALTVTVVGSVEIYQFALPTGGFANIPCVVLTLNGSTRNPCQDAGGVYRSTIADLIERTEKVPLVRPEGLLASVTVCEAQVTLTVGGIGVEQIPALTIC